MRQYELAIRIAQVHHLVDERKYKKALAVIQTLDMHQVRSLSDLRVFAEVYTKTEQYEAAKATYLRIYRRSRTKRVLYRLIYLSIRTNSLGDAETYYQEFIRMNPNVRDSLILRYRIDKASGAPIGRLIEILQELKEEEYIEEWAYELAKLYHRAGRKEECLEECEDILLWFGTGEIVERAKILIDHLTEGDSVPYFDDKDFTLPKKEEPNPDDTGSLPDLGEYIKEKKAQKKEDKRESKASEKHAEREAEKHVGHKADENGFIDDYEDTDFDGDGMGIPQVAKDGIQKLSGFLKFGKKEEELQEAKENKTDSESEKESEPKAAPVYKPHSQSGTGITQDLAKEISAIYEMEHRDQLKEKTVTVVDDVPNLAMDVVGRMQSALQKNTTKTYIPLDVEEIRGEEEILEVNGPEEKTKEIEPVEEDIFEDEMAEEGKFEDIPTEEEHFGDAMEQTPSEKQLETMLEAEVAEIQQVMQERESDEEEERKAEEALAGKSHTEAIRELLEEEIEEPEEIAENAETYQTSEEYDTYEVETEIGEAEPETLMEEAAEPEMSEAEPEITMEEPEVAAGVEISEPPRKESILEGYKAPEIPIHENQYNEMPTEITYDDLPTTRALHRSFKDILKLIRGELDPSHFVLMGEGEERLIGVTKKIVSVMKETGYLGQGKIAKIDASLLNETDLIGSREQLKGNCLLVDHAADLLFPTISRIFSIMDEYQGDFVVILADEGNTLDQLFRFVPALARRFKYIIDISEYGPKDYQ